MLPLSQKKILRPLSYFSEAFSSNGQVSFAHQHGLASLLSDTITMLLNNYNYRNFHCGTGYNLIFISKLRHEILLTFQKYNKSNNIFELIIFQI